MCYLQIGPDEAPDSTEELGDRGPIPPLCDIKGSSIPSFSDQLGENYCNIACFNSVKSKSKFIIKAQWAYRVQIRID